MRETIRLGTRHSPLAMKQASIVAKQLKLTHRELNFDICPIATKGYETYQLDSRITGGVKDVFTKEVDQALLSGEVDIAIHSLKDLPVKPHPDIVIGSIPKRSDPRDALVSVDKITLSELPLNARIGTSSLRRRVQILEFRPDFKVMEITGNVGTRIEKMREMSLDALILAASGIVRLGLTDLIAEILPIEVMLPAAGQGALAVEVKRNDSTTLKIVQSINDQESSFTTNVERTFTERLGGGCNLPVAAYGQIHGNKITLDCMVATSNSTNLIREKAIDDSENSKIGASLAEKILSTNDIGMAHDSFDS